MLVIRLSSDAGTGLISDAVLEDQMQGMIRLNFPRKKNTKELQGLSSNA